MRGAPTRLRRRLVTITAIRRSNARTPRPSQRARYGDTNGITASFQPIGAKPSSTMVAMCTARNTTASSETLRCTKLTVNRGHRSLPQRAVVTIPSTTDAVSSSKHTRPEPRAKYHSGVGPAAATNVTILRLSCVATPALVAIPLREPRTWAPPPRPRRHWRRRSSRRSPGSCVPGSRSRRGRRRPP